MAGRAHRDHESLRRVGTLLGELARDIDHVRELPPDQLSALLYQLAALQSVLASELLKNLQMLGDTGSRNGDRLLTVGEAAVRLACSKDWLYRHHHRLPFAVRNGRQLRFSADGLDRYIRQRAGRESTSLPSEGER